MTKANLNPEIEKKNNALQQLKIEYVAQNSIQPNSWNPNRQSDDDFYLLVSSMTEDGFTQPIIALAESRQIVDGEHRWTCSIVKNFIEKYGIKVNAKNKNIGAELEKVRASGLCKDLPASVRDGKELVSVIRKNRLSIIDPNYQIPVAFVNMTPEQARIATLRHNRARGSEDVELAAMLLKDLAALGAADWAQDSLMLDDAEMNKLLNDIKAPEGLASQEFGEAWQPAKNNVAAPGESSDGKVVEVMSAQAQEARAAQMQRIAVAKTEEERVSLQKDMDVVRLSFMFTGEEATLAKQALAKFGEKQAEAFLAMCKSVL